MDMNDFPHFILWQLPQCLFSTSYLGTSASYFKISVFRFLIHES
jgi:hypothetical protein